MSTSIILKKDPCIKFQLMEHGIQVMDEQTEANSGFYAYEDLQRIELNRVWFPRLSVWMRILTTILNGVPYFPDADSYKLASLVVHFKTVKVGIWLTDSGMAKKAKDLKKMLSIHIKLKTAFHKV